MTLDPTNAARATQFLNATARLKPGVSIAQAQDVMNGLALGLANQYPDTNAGKSIDLFSLKEQINGDAPRLILILTGAIVAVLLIACLNVASLLTVRASTRGSELAVRTALGATGRRLRRQLMALTGSNHTAGLMAQSARRLVSVDPGFRTDNVLTFGVVLPGAAYPEPKDRVAFANRVVDGLNTLPGVRTATIGGYAPMGDMRATRRFARLDQPLPPTGQEPVALDLPVGADYFSVMGIEVTEGRGFTPNDVVDEPQVMVISEAFAREHFPNENPIGRQIRFYSSRPGGTPPPTREIVGIVEDVRQDAMRDPPLPQMYSPYAQNTWGFLSFFILVDGDPNAVAIGAKPRALLRLVLGQAVIAAAAGVMIGIVVSLSVTRGLGSLLFEVPANDPIVLASTSMLLMAVSIVAGYLPARRAMINNPASVLRSE